MPNPSRQKGEEFRPLAGCSAYLVSSLGYVIGRRGQIVRGAINPDGYLRLKLTDSAGQKFEIKLHRAVALTFHGPAPSGHHIVAHGDGNPANCREDNLRWATQLENHADRRAHGRNPQGERNGRAKLTEQAVAFIRQNPGIAGKQLAKMFGVSPTAIYEVRSGRKWNHG